jgi:hypothetical protein
MPAIEVLGIALGQGVHQPRAGIRPTRRKQQMDVIAHEAIRVDCASRLLCEVAQQRQVKKVIVLVPETHHPIVAALDDMNGEVRDDQARLARHTEDNGARESALTLDRQVRPKSVPVPD